MLRSDSSEVGGIIELMETKSYFEFVGHEFDPKSLSFKFRYFLQSPDNHKYEFIETLTLPREVDLEKVPANLLKTVFDNLLLILGISYWKTYCPGDIRLNSLQLTKEQAQFWNTVYTKGIGEFFYKNQIDFRGLVNFPHCEVETKPISFPRKNRSLLPIGGGKDSVVSGELLKAAGKKFSAFTLGTHPIQQQVAQVMGVDLLSVGRTIDAQLFELNKNADVFNGHVPISAIYHFVGLLLAILYDYRYVIFSNEASSNYGNLNYLGETINHQWSKSFEFEKMFQDYVKGFITPDVTAFSLLRPAHEIKIVELFSKYSQYFPIFSSCNRNFRINIDKEVSKTTRILGEGWCGECSKCAFVFVSLAAFLPKEKVVEIFGQNLLTKESLTPIFEELLGLRKVKPFECVGTQEETQLAFYLAYEKNEYNKDSIMILFIVNFRDRFPNILSKKESLLSASKEHLIPENFKEVIRNI